MKPESENPYLIQVRKSSTIMVLLIVSICHCASEGREVAIQYRTFKRWNVIARWGWVVEKMAKMSGRHMLMVYYCLLVYY